MAFGLTPKHIEELDLDGMPGRQFIILALEASEALGWRVNYVSENGIIVYTNKGMFSWNASVEIVIKDGIATIKSSSVGNEMFDLGKNKKNVQKFLDKFEEIRTDFSSDELASKYEAMKEDIFVGEDDVLTQPEPTTLESFKSFFGIFKPTDGYFITPVIMNLNIIIFIIMVLTGVNIISPDTESLINWGANFRPLTLDGQPWRLLTSCFLHIGVLHLLLNMYALLFIGIMLEPLLGKARFLSAYLLTGIAASAASLWWNELTVSAGASGAIFGMYGVFLSMLTTNLIEKTARKDLLASISVFVIFNLINGVKGGIDNAAHIGGLASGLIIGYAFVPSLQKWDSVKFKSLTIAAITIVVFLGSFLVYRQVPNEYVIYNTKMDEFVKIEEKALDIYNKFDKLSKEQVLHEIKENGIKNWKEALNITNEIEALSLPEPLILKNRKIRKYCELRIKRYELSYKAIQEGQQSPYKEEMANIDQEIDALLDVLIVK